jgi:beta-glucosidase
MKRKKVFRGSILMTCLLLVITTVAAQPYPFQDTNLPAEKRIDNIISLLTLNEKVACLSTDPSVPRLGIKGTRHVEGLHGLAKGGPSNWGQRDPVTTTIFPQAIGLAESWDPEVIRRVAAIESYETRYIFQSPKYQKGGLVVRAPNADLGRDPRWGRTEECYGEDAWFNSIMTMAFVKGLLGDDPKYWRTASLMKHFLANSNENNRSSSSSNFDERLLREYYSYPFWRGVVEGGSRAYMASYNAYNGIPMTINPILKKITVDEWGENGIICTDGGALGLLVSDHKYFPDLNTAAAACLRAGISQFLDRAYREAVYGALANGYITGTTMDSVLRGNFRVMIKLGILDPPEMVPYSSIGINDTIDPWSTAENHLAAREVTQKTIVLLKNSKNLLPLDLKKIRSIAVIGPHADEVLLDWYSGTPPYTISPLAGIRNKAGNKVEVKYAKDNTGGAATGLAKASDVAIVIVGNHPTCDGVPFGQCITPSDGREAVDRQVIVLEQEELIKEIYNANPNTIVILVSSFPYAINWTQENVPAILHMTHASQEMGNALADVLFGEYNPGGRLVQTWPKSMDQLPPMMDYNIRNGHTYMYFKDEPLYPFGYGLSYTTFSFSNLKISSHKLASDGEITVSAMIKNTGKITGDEVVQLYVRHINSKVSRPLEELKGFKRITIAPNESKRVEIPLKAEAIAYWDVNKHSFVVEPDKIQILVGASSSDIKLQDTVEVAGD